MKKNKIIISILSIAMAVSVMVPGLSGFAAKAPDSSVSKVTQTEKPDASDKDKQDEKKKIDLLVNTVKNDLPAYVVKEGNDKDAKSVVMVPGKAMAKELGLRYKENDKQIRITAANARFTIKNDKDYVLYEKFKGKKVKKKEQLKIAKKTMSTETPTPMAIPVRPSETPFSGVPTVRHEVYPTETPVAGVDIQIGEKMFIAQCNDIYVNAPDYIGKIISL